MSRIYVAIGVIALLLLVGCKGQQVLPSQPPVSSEVESNFEALVASYPEWETFSGKGEVELVLSAGKSISASTQIKMIRGEAIQLSVRVILGLEAARILVTPDSVFVLSKLNRQATCESLEKVGKRLETTLSLETIQEALLGRIFLLNRVGNDYRLSDFTVTEGADSKWMLSPCRQDSRFDYQFELQGIQLLSTYARVTNSTKAVECQYSDFVQQGSSENFPSQMSLSLSGLSTPLSFNLRYNVPSIVWNDKVKVDRLDLSKYRQVSVSQLLKML